MKFRLERELPDLNTGAIFTFDEKRNLYVHDDYGFKKQTVELNPDWFFKIKEGVLNG